MDILQPSTDSSPGSHSGPEIMSIGALHRCILAKLTVKEVRRAINKYRDLMPKESDWNRKLSQSSKKPELGFRYLFRCGQIDDDNNRTLQKMLKYMDRYDILPYFHTLRYQGTCQTASDNPACEDPVDSFLCREVGNGENVLTSPVYRMERKRASDQPSGAATAAAAAEAAAGCLTRSKRRRLSSQQQQQQQQQQVVEPQPRVHSEAPDGAGVPIVDATAAAAASSMPGQPQPQPQQQQQQQAFCDLRMRVRAEYQQIHRLLSNQLHSHRNDPAQRQFDLFFQASNTLSSHDLGDILCDIRFSDLHYLEAFWRDYVSGQLAHAIKNVFVRHYLMDRFNPADVQVHISLDAADYQNGRQVLLRAYAEHYTRVGRVREAMRLRDLELQRAAAEAAAAASAAAAAATPAAAASEATADTVAVAGPGRAAGKPPQLQPQQQGRRRAASAAPQRGGAGGGGGRRSAGAGGGSSGSGVSKRLTRSSTGS